MKCFRLARTFDRCWETFSTTKQVNIFLMVSIFVISFFYTSVQVVLNNHFIFCIETGHIVSAGVTSLALYGQMNVSEADLNKKQKDVLGKQVNIPFGTEKVRIGLLNYTLRYKFSKIFLLKYFSYPLKHLMKQQMKLKIHLFPR